MRYYSKRELYALGETLGDSITEHKVGGGPTQTTSTSNVSNIPEYAQPYVETMLGATQKQLFNMDDSGNITGFSPYKAYGGTYDASGNQTSYDPSKAIAGFSPMQQQAQQGIANMQLPGTYGAGIGMTGNAAMQSGRLAGQEANAGNQLAYNSTDPNAMASYMNPYIQNALNPALQLSNQQYGMKGAQEQGAATSAGAFGGSRNALMQGLNQQNQMLANNQLIGNAYNQAYTGAQNQMNTVAQTGLAGQQAAMQGIGQQGAMANQLAGIGGQALQAQQGIYGLQNQSGAAQQAQQQQIINQAMTDYSNAQQYPLMQLGTMSNMLRGLPMQASTTNQYVAAPNAITQGIGLAGAGASIYNALGSGSSTGKKAGGIVGYNVGGSVRHDLYEMEPDEIQDYIKTSASPSAKKMAEEILRDKIGKAGGGIIAFANPTEENNQSLVQSPQPTQEDIRNAYIADAQRQAKESGYVAPKPAARVAAPMEYSNPAGEAVPSNASEGTFKQWWREHTLGTPENLGIKAAAPVSASPAPVATPAASPNATLPPMPTNVKVDDKGRADAANQNPAPGGIKSAAPSARPSSPAAPAATNGDPFGLAPPVDPDAGKTIAQLAAEKAAYMGPNTGNQDARAQMMAERTNAKDEARRAQSLRMAEFFGAWGSTPGNTIVAGLNALKNKIPDFISDMKEESRVRREIDKSISELDKIDRLEKSGNWDEAAKRKDALGKRDFEVWGKKVDALSHKYTADAAVRAASVRSGGNSDTSYFKALANESKVVKEIAEARKDTTYQRNAVLATSGSGKVKEDAAAWIATTEKKFEDRLKGAQNITQQFNKMGRMEHGADAEEEPKNKDTTVGTAKLVKNKDGTFTYQR